MSSLSVDVMSPSNKLKLCMQHDTKNTSGFPEILACMPFSNQPCEFHYNRLPLDSLLNQCLTLKDVFSSSSIKSVFQI